MLGNEPGEPRGVDEAERDQVAKVGAILVSIRVQLHPHQRLKRHYFIVIRRHLLGDIGRGERIAVADFFIGKEEVKRVARAPLGAVEETLHPHHGGVHEAHSFKRRLDGGQVAATDEDVDILRVADGGSIDTRDPRGDRIAAGDGLGDPGFLQGGGGPQRPIANGLHGLDHPLPGEGLELNGHSERASGEMDRMSAGPLSESTLPWPRARTKAKLTRWRLGHARSGGLTRRRGSVSVEGIRIRRGDPYP